MKNNILKITLVLSVFFFAIACNNDDATGHSTTAPSAPTLTVDLSFANTQTLIEDDVTYGFTVSISEPQIVNVKVYLSQIGGTAINHEDFTIPDSVTIPAGATSVSDVIEIHADELAEDTENAVIQIATGLESNVQAINDQTVTFNIVNLVEGDLQVGLQWDTLGYQFPDGAEFDPTVLADLRLLLSSTPDASGDVDSSDGGGFESATIDGALADGDYYVVADWYAAYDLGDQGFFPLNLTATFDQVGVINDMHVDFANALNSGNSCSSVYFVIATVNKSGENYTITPTGENSPVTAAPFIGTASVVTDDWADYAAGDTLEVEAGSNANEFWIRSYDNPYISNPGTSYMIVTIDPATGDVTVMSNEVFDYGCSDGTITGSGSVNACAGTIDLVLTFDLGDCGAYPNQGFTLQL